MNHEPDRTPLVLRGVSFDPPLFCAPMAGITHSAFRRLLADFGGTGALYTEMLSAKMLIHEDPLTSPWIKRRPQEGRVIYQLLVSDTSGLDRTLERLAPVCGDGIDINLGCPAATVHQQGGGSNLFDDPDRLRGIVAFIRARHHGPLLAKIRLGQPGPNWRGVLRDRLKLLEDEGVDALTVHTRFAEESLNRFPARHVVLAELATETRLPLIANGDITGPDYARVHAAPLAAAAGLMIGRMAAARPWIFGQWHRPDLPIDPAAIWERLCDYLEEDFPPNRALVKLKVFTPFFARNFMFGHTLYSHVQGTTEWSIARERARQFLAEYPPIMQDISLSGL